MYIREAHPADGWQMASNEKDDVIFDQPKAMKERQSVAQACCSRLRLSMPCVVDTIENTVDDLYAGWPERLFVIDAEGSLVYAGQQGPWGFKPREAERALRQLISKTRR